MSDLPLMSGFPSVPEARVTWSGDPLPFPPALEAVGFRRDVASLPQRTLADGIAATAAHLRAAAGLADS